MRRAAMTAPTLRVISNAVEPASGTCVGLMLAEAAVATEIIAKVMRLRIFSFDLLLLY